MPQRTSAGSEHGARRRFALSVSPSGHGAPDLAVHRMRCMHDAACVFPQPRVDSLAIHLSRQVDPGSCARSDGGTVPPVPPSDPCWPGLRPLLVSSRVQNPGSEPAAVQDPELTQKCRSEGMKVMHHWI